MSKELDDTLAAIDKQFGKGSIMKMGGKTSMDIEVISTGSLAIDRALGIGGLPRGRVVEVFGSESSGKTTLALHAVVEAQRQGLVCAFVDQENALDPQYARAIGVNLDEMLISQPDTGEQALGIVDILAKSGTVGLIVVDSVAALTPRAEIEGDVGDVHMGLQARMMSQALRKITGNLNKTNTTVLFTNQLRSKIGTFFGPSDVTTGGNALKYYASIRLDIRRIGQLKDGDEIIGNQTRVKVVKNKCSSPFTQAEFQIVYGEGINQAASLIDIGVELGIIKKSGAWYKYGDEQLGQGMEQAKKTLTDDSELFQTLNQLIRDELGLKG